MYEEQINNDNTTTYLRSREFRPLFLDLGVADVEDVAEKLKAVVVGAAVVVVEVPNAEGAGAGVALVDGVEPNKGAAGGVVAGALVPPNKDPPPGVGAGV